MGRRSSYVAPLAAFAALALTAELAYLAASSFSRTLAFDVGPSTGAYLTGFTESEERPPVSFRWTGERASLSLPPLARPSSGTLELRYARFLEGTARIHLFVKGERLRSTEARSGRFRTEAMPLELTSDEQAQLEKSATSVRATVSATGL